MHVTPGSESRCEYTDFCGAWTYNIAFGRAATRICYGRPLATGYSSEQYLSRVGTANSGHDVRGWAPRHAGRIIDKRILRCLSERHPVAMALMTPRAWAPCLLALADIASP